MKIDSFWIAVYFYLVNGMPMNEISPHIPPKYQKLNRFISNCFSLKWRKEKHSEISQKSLLFQFTNIQTDIVNYGKKVHNLSVCLKYVIDVSIRRIICHFVAWDYFRLVEEVQTQLLRSFHEELSAIQPNLCNSEPNLIQIENQRISKFN